MKVHFYLLHCLAAGAGSAALFLAGLMEPRFGSFASFFSPAAIILVTCRYGSGKGLAATLLAIAFALPLVPSLPAALSFAAVSAFPALILGILLLGSRRVVRSAAVAALSALLLSFFVSYLHLHLAGVEVVTFLRYQAGDMLRESLSALNEFSSGSSGISREKTALLAAFLTSAMPSILLTTIFLQFSLNALIALHALRKISPPDAWRAPDLSSFRVPDLFVWLLIASLSLLWLSPPPIRIWSMNLALCLLFLYLMQGLSIFVHYLDRGRASRPVRMILVILALLQPYVLLVPLLAGILDFKFDFRRPRPAPP